MLRIAESPIERPMLRCLQPTILLLKDILVQQIKDTMAGKSSNKIENLNNQNYQTWKFKMELLLIKEDLWETVTKEIPDLVTAEWHTKDAKARAIIGLQVADNQLHLIRKQTTAKG